VNFERANREHERILQSAFSRSPISRKSHNILLFFGQTVPAFSESSSKNGGNPVSGIAAIV
jgi:hypothetical protein